MYAGVAVREALCCRLAVGELTAFPVDAGPDDAFGPVVDAPRLLPLVPWLRAFEVFDPGLPPVPLMVLPFVSVLPVDPPAPVAAPELAAPPDPPPPPLWA